MKIAVCIKQVPVVSALQFDAETKTLKREGVRTEVSSFDVRAVLKAIELRDAHGGDVVAVTMGPPQAREALAECLALGADRAIHLCDRAFAGADTLATARALALAFRREDFDLILCGRNSVDAETGQVGPELAELLDLPQVTVARTLRIDLRARRLSAERETDDGVETVTAPLPAVVTAAEDLAPERFTTKAEREAAQAKPIATVSAADLDADPALLGAPGSPTWVLGLEAVEEHRRRELIEAENPEAAAALLVQCLLAHGLFGEWSVERHTRSPGVTAPVPREEARDVLVVAEAVECGSLLPLWGGSGGEENVTTPQPTPKRQQAAALQMRPVTRERLEKGRELAAAFGGAVSVLVAGADATRHVDILAAHGADCVLLAADDAFNAGTESYAALLADVITTRRPGVVILPSTVWGRDVAPRVAARLGLGLTGECIDLTIDADGRVLQHKPAFGGSVVALIASRTRPEMATVRAGMLPAGTARPGRTTEVIRIDQVPVRDRVRVVDRQLTSAAAAELEEARTVVGFGKGIGGPENLPIVRALADALDAAICTTRDVTDAGWLPKQYQVGVTGRAIAPDLYLAVALRGAFEHVVGIRRAGLVVAINKSAKAPIFKAADYGVVGDYAAIVPALTAQLRAAKRRARPEQRLP
jgi:electron transfer flavoprotein alpha subunit